MEDYKKKYEEAIFRMNKWVEGSEIIDPKEVAEFVFPELKESGDEKIRKELIKVFEEKVQHGFEWKDEIPNNAVLSWLEKQGEQKPSDKVEPKPYFYCKYGGTNPLCSDCKRNHNNSSFKTEEISTWYVPLKGTKYCMDYIVLPEKQVEPKFKVGDWVRAISSGNIFKILSVNDGLYRVLCYDGVEANYPIEEVEKDLTYWTIQDAKDGDVLKEDSCIFIIERMNTNGTAIVHCCLFGDSDFDLGSTLSFDIDSTYPATKEQRDLLFQNMKEAGYEWDAEKKELRKIEHNPAWSEEDEEILSLSLENLTELKNRFGEKYGKVGDCIHWLKSIKDRIPPQPKQDWSEGDENTLNTIVEKGDLKPSEIQWLKSIKERMKGA